MFIHKIHYPINEVDPSALALDTGQYTDDLKSFAILEQSCVKLILSSGFHLTLLAADRSRALKGSNQLW